MKPLSVRKITGRIVIIDDEQANVRLLERMLKVAGCEAAFSTTDPRNALDLCVATQPDAVLLDLNMPYLDGFQLLEQFAVQFPCRTTLPILVLTADANTNTKHRALESGATDFLTKPLDALELVLRLGNHLENRRLHLEVLSSNHLLETRVEERTQELLEAQAEIVDRLSVATESRDDDTGEHVERVATMAAWLAQAMGLPLEEVELIRRASRLHDIGKISVPDRVLLKEGPLTPEEREIIKSHAAIGGDILRGSRFRLLILAEQIARHHHERWDGQGYPNGLSGAEIPLAARIVSVADVFDALTHERPYKKAWTAREAAKEIVRQSGSQFDPAVVKAFLSCLPAAESLLAEEPAHPAGEPATLAAA